MSSNSGSIDIFQILSESKKKKREDKTKLLESLGIKEYFKDGSVIIDKKT